MRLVVAVGRNTNSNSNSSSKASQQLVTQSILDCFFWIEVDLFNRNQRKYNFQLKLWNFNLHFSIEISITIISQLLPHDYPILFSSHVIDLFVITIAPGIGASLVTASLVTALFNRRLERLAQQRGVALPEDVVAHFDCRAGLFDTVPFVVGGNRGRNGGTVEKNMAPGLLRWDG